MTLQEAQEKIESLSWIMQEKRPFKPDNWHIYRLLAAPSTPDVLQTFYEQYIINGAFSDNWEAVYLYPKDREDFEVFVHFNNTSTPGHTGNNVILTSWNEFVEDNPEIQY